MPTVKFYATFRKITGTREAEFDAGTIEELLGLISGKYGDKIDRYLGVSTVLLNGTNISKLKGKKTRLKAGDSVSLFPPLAGG